MGSLEIILENAARPHSNEEKLMLANKKTEDADSGVAAGLAGGMKAAGAGQAAANPKATYAITSVKEILEFA